MQEAIPEFTVSEISFAVKRSLEGSFSRVCVKGEIFGCKRADSGHWYLSLKDENANLAAVCWKGVAAGLAFKPEDGLEVAAVGKITAFAGKSSYQLVIERMEIAGAGALLKLLEERKQKFAAEGLFDAAHKNPIPFLPEFIFPSSLTSLMYAMHPRSMRTVSSSRRRIWINGQSLSPAIV